MYVTHKRLRDLVGERWSDFTLVELDKYDRKQQDDNSKNHCQPERSSTHQHCCRSHVRIAERFGVEDEYEDEVEEDAAPDDKVVKSGPVGRVQGALQAQETCKNDQTTQFTNRYSVSIEMSFEIIFRIRI